MSPDKDGGHQQARIQGLIITAICWFVGAKNPILAARLGFVIVIGLLGGLAAVLLLDEPLWIFGILAGAMVVVSRIAVPIVVRYVFRDQRRSRQIEG